jgi:hypothetical protein
MQGALMSKEILNSVLRTIDWHDGKAMNEMDNKKKYK